MPPRNPLQQLEIDGCRPGTRFIDLLCYEEMPRPEDLRPPVLENMADTHSAAFPTLAVDTTCWCLEQCNPHGICARIAHPSRKRKYEASPEPRIYFTRDENWVQTINLWHPGDFDKTIVEMDSDLPMGGIFAQLCDDLRIDRKYVKFVWKRNRRRGGVQSVVLKDTDAPWDVGMKQDNAETVECEYIS